MDLRRKLARLRDLTPQPPVQGGDGGAEGEPARAEGVAPKAAEPHAAEPTPGHDDLRARLRAVAARTKRKQPRAVEVEPLEEPLWPFAVTGGDVDAVHVASRLYDVGARH